MIPFDSFFYINEAFDTVSDFLLNPAHRDKRFWDLMKEFEASGGKQIGSGKYGTVYSHPSWPYVIKTFTKDDPYLRFARYASQNPYPPFPKFYGPPKKIVPEYTREARDKELYLSRIEKLEPLEEGEFDAIEKARRLVADYKYYRDTPYKVDDENSREHIQKLKAEVDALPREIYNVLVGLDLLEKYFSEDRGEASFKQDRGQLDWHGGNIMKRANGDYVLIDPAWEGFLFNAHADADHAMKMETDYYGGGDEYAPPPTPLRGGQLPKKKRVKKVKPVAPKAQEPDPFDPDDIPF